MLGHGRTFRLTAAGLMAHTVKPQAIGQQKKGVRRTCVTGQAQAPTFRLPPIQRSWVIGCTPFESAELAAWVASRTKRATFKVQVKTSPSKLALALFA